MNLLQVENLSVFFETSGGPVQALRNISFHIEKGEAVGIVGESGSGKSVTSLAIMDLLPSNLRSKTGKLEFSGKSLFGSSEQAMQKIRGSRISMIFQDPMSALNPCFNIYDQMDEILRCHTDLKKQSRYDRIIEFLQLVRIPDPQSRLKSYPHELSGGMSQRVMIAMALLCYPELLIADEPTTALDVTIQAQILSLLSDLRKKQKMALMMISHDLGIISALTNRTVVMYAGEIVEEGPTQDILSRPIHPYTEGLLKCLPSLQKNRTLDSRLPTIPGIVPSLLARPSGCQLSPRCEYKQVQCEQKPVDIQTVDNRKVRCLFPLLELGSKKSNERIIKQKENLT